MRGRAERRFAAAGCVLALASLGCSGDDDSDAGAASSSAVPSSSAASTTLDPIDTSPGAPIVTTVPTTSVPSDDTAPLPSSTTVLSFTGDADSEWCDAAAELVLLSDAFAESSVANPAALELTLTAFVDRMSLIAFIAPVEIVDDVVASVGAFGEMLTLLDAAEFDMGTVDLSSIDAQRESLADASNRIATYNRDVCGLRPTAATIATGPTDTMASATTIATTSATGPDTPTAESTRRAAVQLLIDGGYSADEAECIVTVIEERNPSSSSPDQQDLVQRVLAACGVDLERTTP